MIVPGKNSTLVWCGTSACLLTPFLLLIVRTARAETPGPEELLNAYERTLSALDPAEYRVVLQQFLDRPAFQRETLVRKSEWLVRRDGARWKLTREGIQWYAEDGERINLKRLSEYVYDEDNSAVFVNSEPDVTGRRLDVFANLNLSEDDKREVYSHDAFMLVYGYLIDNGRKSYLPDILRESQLSVSTENVGPRKLYVLEGVGVEGVLQLWLDPLADYLPRKMQLRKASHHIVDERPLASFPGIRSFEVRVNVDRIEELAGVPVLAAFQVERTLAYNDRTLVQRIDCELLNINLAPRFDERSFRMATSIPNGTVVQVLDEPTIVYQWSDGEIVKAVDQDGLRRLEGHEFLGGRWSGWSLALLLGNGIVAVVIAAWLYLRQRD